jgi:hypothetical protein
LQLPRPLTNGTTCELLLVDAQTRFGNNGEKIVDGKKRNETERAKLVPVLTGTEQTDKRLFRTSVRIISCEGVRTVAWQCG